MDESIKFVFCFFKLVRSPVRTVPTIPWPTHLTLMDRTNIYILALTSCSLDHRLHKTNLTHNFLDFFLPQRLILGKRIIIYMYFVFFFHATFWKEWTGYNRRQNCWDTVRERGNFGEHHNPHPSPSPPFKVGMLVGFSGSPLEHPHNIALGGGEGKAPFFPFWSRQNVRNTI